MDREEAFNTWADSKEANRVDDTHQNLISVREITHRAFVAGAEWHREAASMIPRPVGWNTSFEDWWGYVADSDKLVRGSTTSSDNVRGIAQVVWDAASANERNRCESIVRENFSASPHPRGADILADIRKEPS